MRVPSSKAPKYLYDKIEIGLDVDMDKYGIHCFGV